MGLSIASDLKLLMWTDELFTLFTARLQDVSKVLQAIQEGSAALRSAGSFFNSCDSK
jgi:hypothetical protein